MTDTQAIKKELSREVFETIRRIEDLSVSISSQAYAYREPNADHRPLVAKDILRLIAEVQEAGEAFRDLAKIAE